MAGTTKKRKYTRKPKQPKEDSVARTVIVEPTEPLTEVEVAGDGHEPGEIIPEQTKYKYCELQIAQIPDDYRQMTPKWLHRRLHWEEQAKIARVKGIGLGDKVKIGAVVAVLCLFGIVILLFGLVIMGGE